MLEGYFIFATNTGPSHPLAPHLDPRSAFSAPYSRVLPPVGLLGLVESAIDYDQSHQRLFDQT